MSLEAPRRNRTDPVVSERLLANLLVSEYILQAWSLLETAKGAKALYLLCKDDIAVPLQYIIQTIYARGSVDLATLCLFNVLAIEAKHKMGACKRTNDS